MRTVTLLVIMAARSSAADKVSNPARIYHCGRIQGAIDAVSGIARMESDLVVLLRAAQGEGCEAIREAIGYKGVGGRQDELLPEKPKPAPKPEKNAAPPVSSDGQKI